MTERGFVYIVGAGPGDPDLITVKGLRSLRQADVVLHDQLVDVRLLEEVRPDAIVINVGKRKGSEDAQQARIHRLMVQYARAGKIVCRLKGGDPFIFGRASEEIDALLQAAIPFEIVPGLSSVTAAATSGGILLTRRGESHAFMAIAGSRSLDLKSDEWKAARLLLMAGGSVVVMMGLARVPVITEWLQVHGCHAHLPAAIVSRATWPDQDTLLATLGSIAVHAETIESPAVLILGGYALVLHTAHARLRSAASAATALRGEVAGSLR